MGILARHGDCLMALAQLGIVQGVLGKFIKIHHVLFPLRQPLSLEHLHLAHLV